MLNMAIIGCGYWGPNLVRNFDALPDCRVKTVCDADPGRLSQMKSLYPHIETTTDIDEVVRDSGIDAVVVATPVRFHYDLAGKALRAGKHTFIEKPMAASVEECQRLIELAEAGNLTLMVGHTFLYSSAVRTIKGIIDSGELGDILLITSRRLNLGLFQSDINVAWDLAPHDISIVLHILGEPPVSVSCQGKAHVLDGIEDITNMTLHFAGGAFATIQSSWLDPNKTRQTTFVGTKRMLVYDDLAETEKIKIYDKRVELTPKNGGPKKVLCSYYNGDVHSPYVKPVEPLRVECQHFADCISEGVKPISDGYNGMMVVRVLEAATQSLRNSGGSHPLSHQLRNHRAPLKLRRLARETALHES